MTIILRRFVVVFAFLIVALSPIASPADNGAAAALCGSGNPGVCKSSADIQRELLAVLAEGGDHLGYSRAMLNYLKKWHKTNEQKTDDENAVKPKRSQGRNINYGDFRRNSDFDYFSLLSGGIAIRESLQLDSIREINDDETAKIAISNLKGPEIKSHPFKEMMQGRPYKLSVLDATVPENFYYVHSGSLTNFLEFVDYLGDKGNALYRRYDITSVDYHLKEKYLTQLALKENPNNRKYYDFVISEMVITGSDPFFRNGSDVSMIFKIKHPLIFEMMIKRYRNEFQSRFSAHRQSVNIDSINVDHLFTADRQVNAFYFQLSDDVYVVSNSIGAVRKIIAVHMKKEKSMADADDYKYMRSLLASSGDDELFVYLSDSFVRHLVGPELRIKEARRMRLAALLANLEKYILLYYQIYKKSPATITELVKGLEPPGLEGEHAKLFPSLNDNITIAGNGFNAVCKEYGSVHRLVPNIDVTIDSVTKKEADLYNDFVKNYHNFWRDYFDPIGINIHYDEGKLYATTHILPLINSSFYNTLVSYVGGQPVNFSSATMIPEEMMRFTFKLNTQMKNSFGEFMNLRRHQKDTGKWDDFLGDYAEVYMLDAVPMVDFNAKILLDGIFQTGSSRNSVPVLYVFGAWSLFHPLRLTIPIKDAGLKDTFEKALITRLNELAVSPAHADMDTYCTIYKGKQIRTVRLGLWGVVNLRLYYLFNKDLHITTTEDYMRRIIDHLDDLERNDSSQKTNVAFQMFPSRVKLEKDIFAANLIEGTKLSSFHNLGTMKLLHTLFPRELDLGKKAYDTFGFEPVCPAKGKYLFDAQNKISNSLFGTPENQFILKDEVMKNYVDELLKTPKIEVRLQFHETGIITDMIIE